jgi:hypothetical protein
MEKKRAESPTKSTVHVAGKVRLRERKWVMQGLTVSWQLKRHCGRVVRSGAHIQIPVGSLCDCKLGSSPCRALDSPLVQSRSAEHPSQACCKD